MATLAQLIGSWIHHHELRGVIELIGCPLMLLKVHLGNGSIVVPLLTLHLWLLKEG